MTLTVLAKENTFLTYIVTNEKGRHFTEGNDSDLMFSIIIDLQSNSYSYYLKNMRKNGFSRHNHDVRFCQIWP